MRSLNIYVSDDTEERIITISSNAKFSTAKMKKEDVKLYGSALDYPGVYMLLIGEDSVYVGMSDLDTVRNRIMNTHSGTIDSDWHTVIGFLCNSNLSTNEYRFLENSLCEYAHQHFAHCVTTTPSVKNCNAKYREKHYGLTVGHIHSCNQYMGEFIEYLYWLDKLSPDIASNDAKTSPMTATEGEWETFYYSNSKGVIGIAEILIHCGHDGKRTTKLKAGSALSADVSTHFSQCNSIKKQRAQLEAEGKIANGTLTVDIEFTSQSSAGQFLNGTSFNGNANWKTAQGVPLKDLLV